MKHLMLILVLAGMLPCLGEEIVVLTETPVAKFTLPDGTVLKNAYAWRKSSEGIMIIHDGGNYFLNYMLLPDDWKEVYLDPPDDTIVESEPEEAEEPKEAPARTDRYKAREMLATIPGLDSAARDLLLNAGSSGPLDPQVLMLGVCQNLLKGKRTEAKRFLLFIEEKEYEPEGVDFDLLFRPCGNCGGDGQLHKICQTCDGSGECDRCEGEGSRKSSFDDSRTHCTTCRGKGTCPRCKGEGGFTLTCPKCKGAGKLVDQRYCEILRDRIVRDVNALATPDRWVAVTASASSHMDKVLANLPDLSESARAFYRTEDYLGGMDTNLVVAGFLYSLLKEDFKEADRFNLMLDALYPEEDVIEMEKYIKTCPACQGSGHVVRDCRVCRGSGRCVRCDGEGQRKLEVDKSMIHCTTCRGTGKCTGCRGLGTLRLKCSACEGRGRVLDRQRTEIKLSLLVDRLNDFHDAR